MPTTIEVEDVLSDDSDEVIAPTPAPAVELESAPLVDGGGRGNDDPKAVEGPPKKKKKKKKTGGGRSITFTSQEIYLICQAWVAKSVDKEKGQSTIQFTLFKFLG